MTKIFNGIKFWSMLAMVAAIIILIGVVDRENEKMLATPVGNIDDLGTQIPVHEIVENQIQLLLIQAPASDKEAIAKLVRSLISEEQIKKELAIQIDGKFDGHELQKVLAFLDTPEGQKYNNLINNVNLSIARELVNQLNNNDKIK